MSKLTLNAVITRALMDAQFRQALLRGQVEQALAEFPLGEEERWILEHVQATTLDGFVAQVHELMHQQQAPIPTPAVGMPMAAAYQAVGAA